MHVLLPDGKQLNVPEAATGKDVAEAIGPGLARAALGVRVNGKLSDLQSQVPAGAKVEVVTKRDDDAMLLARHTLAHVMAQAVQELFVAEGADRHRVHMGIGPVIENGFYYDFDLPRSLNPDDLVKIEARMRELVKANMPLVKYSLPREEALQRYRELGDPYKVELIEDLPQARPSPSTSRVGLRASPTCAAARTYLAPAPSRPTSSS